MGEGVSGGEKSTTQFLHAMLFGGLGFYTRAVAQKTGAAVIDCCNQVRQGLVEADLGRCVSANGAGRRSKSALEMYAPTSSTLLL